jgi:hypothetical protein
MFKLVYLKQQRYCAEQQQGFHDTSYQHVTLRNLSDVSCNYSIVCYSILRWDLFQGHGVSVSTALKLIHAQALPVAVGHPVKCQHGRSNTGSSS